MDDLYAEANKLLGELYKDIGDTLTCGYLTNSVYDTAWVSMLRDPSKSEPTLLFPECYRFILDHQQPSGGWAENDQFDVDIIVNTLAGLLALKRNLDIPTPDISFDDTIVRISDATTSLERTFQHWDVPSSQHVAFELIIPHMLELLEKDGIVFDFPGKPVLESIRNSKLKKIPKSIWSSTTTRTTLAHTFEAFASQFDTAAARHHIVGGSMESSPSATAGYLMHSTIWDQDAERYLRTLLASRKPEDIGGVPNVFPTAGFEILWLPLTLLENGFEAHRLHALDSILVATDKYYQSLNGLTSSFSIQGLADGDSTAKSIVLRNLLNKPTTPNRLIQEFEGKNHFLTFSFERNPSLSMNSHALQALATCPNPAEHIEQIEKVVNFLCSSWLEADSFLDKWHVSEFYPLMLMSEAFVRLFEASERGALDLSRIEAFRSTVPSVLVKAFTRTLLRQNSDGSWGVRPSKEITAYGIIALGNLTSFPFAGRFSKEAERAISKGRAFITEHYDDETLDRVWVGKTVYSPLRVSKSYLLAALRMIWPKYNVGASLEKDYFPVPEIEGLQMQHPHALESIASESCSTRNTLETNTLIGIEVP